MSNVSQGRFLKLPANDGNTAYSTTNNKVHFTLPTGDYDLSKAYLMLYTTIETTDSNPASGTGIYNVAIDWNKNYTGGNIPELKNSVFVRNLQVSSSNRGLVCNERRCDVFNHNIIAPYTRSTSQMICDRNSQINSVCDEFEVVRNPLVKLRRQGNVPSSYDRTPVIIKLSDISGFFNKNWSSSWADCEMMFELNLENLYVRPASIPILPPDVEVFITTFNAVAGSQTQATPVSSITIQNWADNLTLEQSPYHVGQKLQIGGLCSNGDIVNEERVISDITLNADDSLTLTFSQTIYTIPAPAQPTDPAFILQDIIVSPVAPATAGFTIDYAEMVVFESAVPLSPPENVMSYTTEEFRQTASDNVLKQFDIEPQAVNCVVCPVVGDLVSNNPHLTNSRVFVNNLQLNDRDVEYNNHTNLAGQHKRLVNGVYYNNLSMTLRNMGITPVNINELQYTTNHLRNRNQMEQEASKLTILPVPMYATQQQKLLQVNLEADGNHLDHLVLFKQYVKVF